MKAFFLAGAHVAKLKELAEAICPQYLLRATQYESNFLDKDETLERKTFTWWYVSDGKGELIGWFEFCMTEAARFVVKEYSHVNNQSLSWSHRMIMQKLGHDLPEVNPIDTLHDLWKNPQTYVEGL